MIEVLRSKSQEHHQNNLSIGNIESSRMHHDMSYYYDPNHRSPQKSTRLNVQKKYPAQKNEKMQIKASTETEVPVIVHDLKTSNSSNMPLNPENKLIKDSNSHQNKSLSRQIIEEKPNKNQSILEYALHFFDGSQEEEEEKVPLSE